MQKVPRKWAVVYPKIYIFCHGRLTGLCCVARFEYNADLEEIESLLSAQRVYRFGHWINIIVYGHKQRVVYTTDTPKRATNAKSFMSCFRQAYFILERVHGKFIAGNKTTNKTFTVSRDLVHL